MSKLPSETSATDREIDAFLDKVKSAPAPIRRDGDGPGRLIFAMDATASRQPSWDQACAIQAEMFDATADLGGLAVQLVFYRGFGECKASKWTTDARGLGKLMTSVMVRGGRTQIGRVLKHAKAESDKHKVAALVFVGDAFEEDIDKVCHIAGELGLMKLPVFTFQEGRAPHVERAFREIARLTGGAWAPFDAGSAAQLKALLSAVAVYAAGGKQALLAYGQRQGGEVLMLADRFAGRR